MRRLADKEKELEALRTKIDNQASVGEEDAAKLQKIEELNKQLEVNTPKSHYLFMSVSYH